MENSTLILLLIKEVFMETQKLSTVRFMAILVVAVLVVLLFNASSIITAIRWW